MWKARLLQKSLGGDREVRSNDRLALSSERQGGRGKNRPKLMTVQLLEIGRMELRDTHTHTHTPVTFLFVLGLIMAEERFSLSCTASGRQKSGRAKGWLVSSEIPSIRIVNESQLPEKRWVAES